MATNVDTLPLVRTRPYWPRITPDPGPRLLELLDRPLTLPVAPAV